MSAYLFTGESSSRARLSLIDQGTPQTPTAGIPVFRTSGLAELVRGQFYSQVLDIGGGAPITVSEDVRGIYADVMEWLPFSGLNRAGRRALAKTAWDLMCELYYDFLYSPNQGTVVYIDLDAGADGSGSFASPRNVIPTLVTGNSYLFKEGTSKSNTLNITVANVLIGTYDSSDGSRVIGKANFDRLFSVEMAGDRFAIQISSSGAVKLSGVRVTQNGTPHAAASTLAIYASAAGGSNNNVFEHVWVDDVTPGTGYFAVSGGIYVRGSGTLVRNCKVSDSELDAIYIWANGSNGPDGLIAYGNEVVMPQGIAVDGPDCFQVATNGTEFGDLQIYDNFLEHNSNMKQCLVISTTSADTDSAQIKRNWMFGPDQTQAEPGGATKGKTLVLSIKNALVENNYLEVAFWGADLSGNNSIFRNNLLIFDSDGGTCEIGVIPQSVGTVVEDNTFIILAGTVDEAIEHTSGSHTGVIIRRNVIANLSGTLTKGIRYNPATATESENTVYGTTRPFVNSGTSSIGAGSGSGVDLPAFDSAYKLTRLPAGLALVGKEISGISEVAAGSYLIPLKAVNGEGTTRIVYPLTVNEPDEPPVGDDLEVITEFLPEGQVGVWYGALLLANVDNLVSWSTAGVPEGLTQPSPFGYIVGLPELAGIYSIDVTVTHPTLGEATKQFVLTIAPASAVPTGKRFKPSVFNEFWK